VTRLRFAPDVALDVERITRHLLAHEAQGIDQRIDDIFDALGILVRHPLIGRPAPQGRRELVIGRDARGYVARYCYDELEDTVVVLALRSQREAGFVDR
jgi:plasmid stabilization system protein ParE